MDKLLIGTLVLALAPGCQYDESRAPGQDQAEAAIWHGLYAADRDPPPVDWVRSYRPDFLWCDEYAIDTGAGCAEGFFDLTTAHVVWPRGERAAPLPTWAHELWHARLFQRSGDADPFHRDPGFGWQGIVMQAEQLISANKYWSDWGFDDGGSK